MDSLKQRVTTATVTLVAVAAFFIPGLAEHMELLPGAQMAEIWRLLTGHLAHYSLLHLFWDLAVFVVLAGWLEGEFGTRRFSWILVFLSLSVSFVVLCTLPEHLHAYRGLSGVDTGLAVLAAGILFRRLSGMARFVPALWVGLLLGKSIWELLSDEAIFVSGGNFVPFPISHFAGAGAAACYLILTLLKARRPLAQW